MAPFRIKQIRSLMGITQGELAERLGIKQSLMSKLEAGTITTDKHDEAIGQMFTAWKMSRVKTLNQEIIYLQSL